MKVYIEYAFLENVCFDGALLVLAQFAAKQPRRWKWICFSACVGGGVAVLFPLLRLSALSTFLLKVSIGAFLPLLAFGRLKEKKEWGRYALSCFYFFLFTFAFGGAMTGFFPSLSRAWIIPVFVAFLVIGFLAVRRARVRKRVERYTYDCALFVGERSRQTVGYLDSGNLAEKDGIPVCFLSAEVFYDLFLCENGEPRPVKQTRISTLSGAKDVPLCSGEVIVLREGKREKRQVYFSPSAHMIGKAYKVLLNAKLFEG